MEKYLGIGFVRVLLALVIVITHASGSLIFNFSIIDPRIAVESFFIISGFYMALVLNEKYTGKNSYYLFITNRLLKIYPQYFIIILVTIGISLVLYLFTGQFSPSPNLDPLSAWLFYGKLLSPTTIFYLLSTNLTIFFLDTIRFLSIDQTGNLYISILNLDVTNLTDPRLFTINPPAWIIGLELSFYIIAPFIVRRKIWGLLIIAGVSFFLRLFLIQYNIYSFYWTYGFFPTELFFFVSGIIGYKFFSKLKTIPSVKQHHSELYFYLFPFLIISIIFFNYFPLDFLLKKILFFSFLFLYLPVLFLITKNSIIDRKIGEFSYSLYLIHFPLIFLILVYFFKDSSLALASCIGSIIISYFLQKYIQEPIEKFRRIRSNNR